MQRINEPTCKEEGLAIGFCVCGDYENIVLQTVNHEYEDGFCVMCGGSENPVYEVIDGFLYFGEYPQTIKDTSVTITETVNEKGYYLGSDNEWYAKVIATPCNTKYTFTNNETIISGSVYYFKVEPIKWQILSQDENTISVVCASIIANRCFDKQTTVYANSAIRAWLNNEFYNTAFSELQQQLILTTEVDNSTESTGLGKNEFACENTYDKVYLLSYAEAFAMDNTTQYDSAIRARMSTDYTRAMGGFHYSSTIYYYYGWLLRSPAGDGSCIKQVTFVGGMNFVMDARGDSAGVVPALQIKVA